MLDLKPWTLPLIVAGVALPIVAAFAVAGPGGGLGVGFLVVAAIVIFAARLTPRGPIETARAPDLRRRILVVAAHEVDDPQVAEQIRAEADLEEPGPPVEIVVLVPAVSGTLDRWASDLRRAREEAQRKLVVSLASLGKADVSARAAMGDQDVVQAVQDQLQAFAATEVILVTGSSAADPPGHRAAVELEERLQQPLVHITAADPAA